MEIQRWNTPVDIEALSKKHGEFMKPYRELSIESQNRLSQYIDHLDNKASFDPKNLRGPEGYEIIIPQTSIFADFLPDAISNRICKSPCSLKLERQAGSIVLSIENPETQSKVTVEVQSKLYSHEIKDGGIYLSDNGEGSFDAEFINELKELRIITSAVLFSKVIKSLLSKDAQVRAIENDSHKPSNSWAGLPLPGSKE